MRKLIRILLAVFFSFKASACIWDAESLSHEKSRSHDLAQTILGESQIQENTNQLRDTLKELEANRKEGDVNWWNNLAGTYLRLNQPQDAVNLLESVVEKFPNDYGIHANLGTAYHLLGRYRDAEKEIARDLEINPNAHFGLEKYHLALLQYLVRDPKYQARHLYVDEFTSSFLTTYKGGHLFADSSDVMFHLEAEDYSNNVAAAEADYASVLKTNEDEYHVSKMLATLAAVDPLPPYRTNWDLEQDTNFEAGVIYMAQMNPKEPACFTMLGMAAWKRRDYHLAATAFENAIALNSLQSELLKRRVAELNEYIANSRGNSPQRAVLSLMLVSLIPLVILYYIYSKIRDRRRARQFAAKN
jgi:tetratricopeptide (TPR) repeat protein